MLEIIKAGQKDIPDIINIENNSFSNPWSLDQITSTIDRTFVAREGKSVKAFICIENVADETHILHMAVHPNHRKLGIAKQLMEFALNFPSKKFFLEVRERNEAAKRLYENFGFKVISSRKNYYQDNNETALVLEFTKK